MGSFARERAVNRWLAAIAALLTVSCGTGGMGDPYIRIFGDDGRTNGSDFIQLTVDGDLEVARSTLDVQFVTWPELEPVASALEVTDRGGGQSVWDVRADSPLAARWYAVIVSVSPPPPGYGRHAFDSHVALPDGRIAFRVFGTSAPRIQRVSFGSDEPTSHVQLRFSEPIEIPATDLPIRVSADGEVCMWYAGHPVAVGETGFECPVFAPTSLVIEVLEDIATPGGAPLPAQTLEIDPSMEFVAPIE